MKLPFVLPRSSYMTLPPARHSKRPCTVETSGSCGMLAPCSFTFLPVDLPTTNSFRPLLCTSRKTVPAYGPSVTVKITVRNVLPGGPVDAATDRAGTFPVAVLVEAPESPASLEVGPTVDVHRITELLNDRQ